MILKKFDLTDFVCSVVGARRVVIVRARLAALCPACCEAGTLAAPCVLLALADVASAAPSATVPLLKAELLPRLLPMLGSVRLALAPRARILLPRPLDQRARLACEELHQLVRQCGRPRDQHAEGAACMGALGGRPEHARDARRRSAKAPHQGRSRVRSRGPTFRCDDEREEDVGRHKTAAGHATRNVVATGGVRAS